MTRLFCDLAISFMVFVPVFFLTRVILRRLKIQGIFNFMAAAVLQCGLGLLGLLVAPDAIAYHHAAATSPITCGLFAGCVTPAAFQFVSQITQAREAKTATAETYDIG